MLQEVTTSAETPGEPKRRWFVSEPMDLYVWYDPDGNILQFQICYDKGPGERALTWHRESGFSHHGVDDGEGGVYRMKRTPVLTGSAAPDPKGLIAGFEALAQKLEHDLYLFITTTLKGNH